MATQDKRTNGWDHQNALNELPLFANLKAPSSLNVLRLPQVIARVGLKRASIYRYISQGHFPKAISLGPRAVGWLEHEIDGWLHQRLSTRNLNSKT